MHDSHPRQHAAEYPHGGCKPIQNDQRSRSIRAAIDTFSVVTQSSILLRARAPWWCSDWCWGRGLERSGLETAGPFPCSTVQTTASARERLAPTGAFATEHEYDALYVMI